MLKFFLVAHLTYENHWGKWHSKIRTFGFFGTPYLAMFFKEHARNPRKQKITVPTQDSGCNKDGEKMDKFNFF